MRSDDRTSSDRSSYIRRHDIPRREKQIIHWQIRYCQESRNRLIASDIAISIYRLISILDSIGRATWERSIVCLYWGDIGRSIWPIWIGDEPIGNSIWKRIIRIGASPIRKWSCIIFLYLCFWHLLHTESYLECLSSRARIIGSEISSLIDTSKDDSSIYISPVCSERFTHVIESESSLRRCDTTSCKKYLYKLRTSDGSIGSEFIIGSR